MTTETTWAFDGSAIARTTALGAVWTVTEPKGGGVLGPPSMVSDHKVVALLDAAVASVPTRLHPARNWGLIVEADASGISAANTERKLYAAWEELAAAFRPGGTVKVACTRKDVSGADVVRHLLVEQHMAPSFTPRTGDPGGLEQPGAYHGADGHILYPIGGVTMFPYWIGSTLLDQDTGAADAELEIDVSADMVTIENPGDRWCGIRLEVKAGSVSGTVTSFRVENAANGDAITLSSTLFAAGDGIDWQATDPRVVSMLGDDTVFGGTGLNKLRLERGENELTATRLGGTGTLTLSLSWSDLRLTR